MPAASLMRNEYRCGESGDHSFASGILIRFFWPLWALVVDESPTEIRSSLIPTVSTMISTSPLSTSGVILRDLIKACGTGSIQTVCQIPLVGVYQMPLGRACCLPMG